MFFGAIYLNSWRSIDNHLKLKLKQVKMNISAADSSSSLSQILKRKKKSKTEGKRSLICSSQPSANLNHQCQTIKKLAILSSSRTNHQFTSFVSLTSTNSLTHHNNSKNEFNHNSKQNKKGKAKRRRKRRRRCYLEAVISADNPNT